MPLLLQLDRLISAFTIDRPLPSDLPSDDDTVVEEDYRLSNYVATSVPLILSVTAGLVFLQSLIHLILAGVDSFFRYLPLMIGASVVLLILAFLIHRSSLQRKTSEVGILGVIAVGTICTYLAATQYMRDYSILFSLPYVFVVAAVAVPFWPERRYFFAGGIAASLPFAVVFAIRPETDLLESLISLSIIGAVLLFIVQETISRANRRMFALAYEVQYRASHDVMTTLSSRSHWFALASAVYDQSMRDHRPLCILYLDIDHFKSFNDHFGHDAGDMVLKQVAEAVAFNETRRDLVSRFGGEEFVLLLTDTSLPQAIARARALHQRVNAIEVHGSIVTVSVGIAEAVSGQTLDEMIIRADRAMLRAKESGRNRTVIATADIPPSLEPPPAPVGVPSIMTEDDLASG